MFQAGFLTLRVKSVDIRGSFGTRKLGKRSADMHLTIRAFAGKGSYNTVNGCYKEDLMLNYERFSVAYKLRLRSLKTG